MCFRLNQKAISIIVLICMLLFVLSACTQANNTKWDSSIRFIDVTNNNTVKDNGTISTALSCIELLKSTCDNPFECKVQDVQYAKSVQVENNDYFLFAFSLGDKAPISALAMYDRTSKNTCIYNFDELIFNPEIAIQTNKMFLKYLNLIQQGNYTGTMLNQGDLEANEIGERILDFYKIWTGEK